ncbi:D-erythronate dehydrogenase [Streptomyces spinosisporus]|uniref:NAD-dependent epimerase/dehydratase family protein n=1 Tax=Streptomyces spinosisporus TaxID=2927582 RepID=A0ABS9XN45_9ACTN|nr:D-erythronate dehydrogenase [Streptomyces spinosisporus]MCI3243491.1 NAD-dependent epimerase/dehydratase family protein [Streptomyces spinosisporus]
MRIVITGASGFLGRLLAERLLHTRTFAGGPITRLVLADRVVAPEMPQASGALVEWVHGDLIDRVEAVFAEPVDVLFHLAAAVSAECEADFDLGMRSNVDSTRTVLEAAKGQSVAGGPVARVVFASSLAVYGSHPALPLPPVISETTLPVPRSSYGTQKLMCEHLIADLSRRGFIDGRVARLMTVAVRPGPPNAAASGFLSGIIREPLAGLPAICPVDAGLKVALSSPRRTVRGIIRVAEAERGTGLGRLDSPLPVNLPALTVSVADMLATLRQVAGDTAADLVTVAPDPAVEAIVGSWPAVFDNRRAAALALQPDPSFLAVVREYLADHPEAVIVGSE